MSMSEQEGARGHGEFSPRDEGMRGIKGRNEVDSFLAQVRERNEGVRHTFFPQDADEGSSYPADHIARTNALADMIYFFRASTADTEKTKRNEPLRKDLRAMSNVASQLFAGENASEKELNLTREYLTKQRNKWEKTAENAVGEEKDAAKAHEILFSSFLDCLHNPIASGTKKEKEAQIDEYINENIEEDIQGIETFANAHQIDKETGKLTETSLPLPPEYEYHLDRARPVVETIANKPKASIADIQDFFAAVTQDVTEQEGAYETQNPRWKEQRSVIKIADKLKSKQKDTIAPDSRIYVASKGGIIKADWDPGIKNDPGTEYYAFDPNAGESEPLSLSRYNKIADQFENQETYLGEVEDILKKAASGKRITGDEMTLLVQQVEHFLLEGRPSLRSDWSEDTPDIPEDVMVAGERMLQFIADLPRKRDLLKAVKALKVFKPRIFKRK